MKITYDPQVDILMVHIGDVARRGNGGAKLPFGGAYADLAEDGTILALEIFDASKKYPRTELKSFTVSYGPMSLEEAARLSGVSAQALRKACERGRMAGKKIGRNWTVTTEALQDYLESRLHAGPHAEAG